MQVSTVSVGHRLSQSSSCFSQPQPLQSPVKAHNKNDCRPSKTNSITCNCPSPPFPTHHRQCPWFHVKNLFNKNAILIDATNTNTTSSHMFAFKCTSSRGENSGVTTVASTAKTATLQNRLFQQSNGNSIFLIRKNAKRGRNSGSPIRAQKQRCVTTHQRLQPNIHARQIDVKIADPLLHFLFNIDYF